MIGILFVLMSMEITSQQQQQKNAMYLKGNAPVKNSLELSEADLEINYGDSALIHMKHDFYNDDFYDYKDTFLGKLNNADNTNKNSIKSSRAPNVNIEAGEVFDDDYDEDEDDEDDDDDVDDNNDFCTGPLAVKKNLSAKQSEDGSGYDNANNAKNQFIETEGEFEDGKRFKLLLFFLINHSFINSKFFLNAMKSMFFKL